MKEIDTRGLTCPAPVLQTKAAIDEKNVAAVRVIVDNEAAKQNVCRFLKSNHYQTDVKENHDDFVITGKLMNSSLKPKEKDDLSKKSDTNKIMVMCATDRMGFGDDALGLKLMISFIHTLKEMGPDLWRLVFVNNGVKLAIEGSEVLPILQELASDGIHILVCGTCLTHFGLMDKKRVGETTNMLDIVTAMQLADKVINI
jgi:selenium metabolism protein YedF